MIRDKPRKDTWFYIMGMLDAYDYIVGDHPSISDDKRPIKLWLSQAYTEIERIELWISNEE